MSKSSFCAGLALLVLFPLQAFAQADPGCAFGTDFSGVQVTQPSGIAFNPGGISNIYSPFDNTGWAVFSGSLAHNGDDLYAQDWRRNNSYSASAGHNVYAAISGVVACTVSLQPGLFGNQMVIWDPSSGFALRYAHLQALNPSLHPGDPVVAGQTLVGMVGNTGLNSSSRQHLHLALYQGVNSIAGTPIVAVTYATADVGTPFAAQYTLATNPTKPITALYPGNGSIAAQPRPWTRTTPACLSGATDTTMGRPGSNVFEIIDLDNSCNHWYARNGSLDSNDNAFMEVRIAVASSSEPGALVAGLADGTKKIQIGLMPTEVGLLDATGTGFLPGSQLLDATTMHTYRLVKNNTGNAELYVDGVLVQTVSYSSLPDFAVTNYRQFFGAVSLPGTGEAHWDYVLYYNTPQP